MRYFKRRSSLIKAKHIKIIASILVAVIIIVVIIFTTAPARELSEKQQAVESVKQIGVLNIGLRADLGPLCTLNTQSGEFEGLEKDVIDEVIYRLFSDQMLVTYVEVNSTTKDALIKTGELDIALGASIKTSASNIIYTIPFFADGSAFLVMQNTLRAQQELIGKTIAIVQDSYAAIENDEDVTKIEQYLESFNILSDLKVYASYPEAVDALEGGHVDAVCANEVYLKLFGRKGMLILPERFLPHEYAIETKSSLATFSSAMSDTIEQMKQDGTMEMLIEKWDLVDYNAL